MSHQPPIDPTWQSFATLQQAINALPDPIFIKDRQHRWIALNNAFCRLAGHPAAALLGASDPDFWPPDQAAIFWAMDDVVFSTEQPQINEEDLTGADGIPRVVLTRKFPVYDDAGGLVGLCGIITDITDLHQRQVAVQRLEAEVARTVSIIEHQRQMLDQLAVPVIEVWTQTLLLPLIGAVDSRRTQQITQNVLAAIAERRAQVLIVDVTGVPLVDTAVAGHIVQTVQAAQLLGCRSIMVGIRPELAQTLVTLGVDLRQMTTLGTLQAALRSVLMAQQCRE